MRPSLMILLLLGQCNAFSPRCAMQARQALHRTACGMRLSRQSPLDATNQKPRLLLAALAKMDIEVCLFVGGESILACE